MSAESWHIMRYSGKFLSSLVALSFGVTSAFAASENWMTDFEAAKEKAAKEDKSLLIDFTGSDWCGWCIRLDKEVFKHDEFNEGVNDDFVLVELDFPRDKSGMSEETIAQNEKLQEEYAVSGFPTILLTDAEGRPFAKTGYQEGGPEKYVGHLDELLEIRAERNAAFKKAEKLEGVEKAGALVEGLKALPIDQALVGKFYGEKVEQIKTLDPEDKTGFVKSIEATRKYSEFESALQKLGQQQDHDGALALIEESLESGDFEGEMQQQIAMIKGIVLAETGEFDKALTAIDEAKAVAPDSELAGRMEMFKQRINQMKEAKGKEEAEGGEE